MTDHKCQNCMFWSKAIGEGGFCCKYPPSFVPISIPADARFTQINSAALFPMTGEEDWCGEWQPANYYIEESICQLCHEPQEATVALWSKYCIHCTQYELYDAISRQETK